MREEISAGWGKCQSCGNEYYAEKVKYPNTDAAHPVGCPTCGITIGHVPKGTDDYNLISEKDIRKRQQEDDNTPNCPICKNKMILREGYSKFWGCSNFPNCNGTIKISKEYD